MTLLVYGLTLIAVGYACRRRCINTEGFFLAGRSFSAAEVGISLAATAFGGSALIAASAIAYQYGLSALWFSGSTALSFIILGLFFAKRIRESGVHSLADFISLHYGAKASFLASSLIVLVEIAFFGLTVKSFAILCRPLFRDTAWLNLSGVQFEVLATALFVVYTLLGGQKANAATAKIQLALIIFTLVFVLMPLSLIKAKLHTLPKELFLFPFGATKESGPLFALNMLVLFGLSGLVGGDVFSKILSAQNNKAAQKGAMIAGICMAILAISVIILTICARAIIPQTEPTLALLTLAKHLLPGVWFELASLTLLSALLSTGDSVLLTGATILTLDVLKKIWPNSQLFHLSLPFAPYITFHRTLTLGLALAGLTLALYFTQMLDMLKFAYTLLTASIAPAALAALLMRQKPTEKTAIYAILSGISIVILWTFFISKSLIPEELAQIDAAVIGACLCFMFLCFGKKTHRSF